MLKHLFISNYALIDELEVTFSRGLTTITGETGAGKSILLGALSLVLGNRADTAVLRNKDRKCIVEGHFDNDTNLLKDILQEHDIDEEDIIILRREINPNGKSRAFINDTPVNLPVMRDIGLKLVDIHSQHENLELNSNLYQLMVVDAFAGLSAQLDEYRMSFLSMRRVHNELSALRDKAGKAGAELDFLSFQFRELEEAGLDADEQTELEAELDMLQHAEEIKSSFYNTWMRLSGDEENAIAILKNAESELLKIRTFYKPSEPLQNRLESLIIELKDIAAEAAGYSEKTSFDPQRMEWINNRINLLYSLQQKHRKHSVEELILLRNDLGAKIDELGSLEFKLEEIEKEYEDIRAIVTDKGKQITKLREAAFPAISKQIVELLRQLGIPNARFQVFKETSDQPGEHGFDNIRFLFTANNKTDLQDISRIASGGELSRLMLAIKYIISGSLGLPTLIFDEIDTGVSGEIAFKVGGIMKEMSVNMQVFTITHLPQVAAKGENHYLVYKEDTANGTTTRLRELDAEERTVEIARMLSGEQTTTAAVENARDLLGMGSVRL